MHDGLSILIALAFIIFSSPYFSRLLNISVAPIEILLGSLAGYFGFIQHNETFEMVSHVAFLFLMFLAGMEIDLRVVLSADKNTIKKGLLYIVLLYVLSSIVTFALNLNKIFIIIIPIMSVGMIFTLFKEYGKDVKWLNLSMLIGSIGEVVSIVILTFTASFLEFGSSSEFWFSIIYLIGFLLISSIGYKLLVVIFWWYPNLKVIFMPHYDKNEKDIRLSIALFFAMIALMIYLKLEIAFGVFIAGMFIATFFDHKKDLPHKLGSFGFGFLVPIFFVYIGTTLKLNNLLIGSVVTYAFFIVFLMLICRIVASLVFVRILSFKDMILYSLSQSMPLTLLVAFATIAHSAGNISDENYSSFILASLLQAIIMLVCIKIIANTKQKTEKKVLA
ncbi:Na+/H+ exchanger family protein [Campylobacter pinnipediorum subsp. caledonicus]|uniref:Na+/H+ exchanger family protein n=1 Tax=Campylobacter pinnipediorum subsp. caledonicus TaxID=1874362 RepID=A0A1S6U8K2_9BACT|nr:cation:proton antiporter [Campylobacter pinnipediorum]AQW86391.1 Na+/H+ exchanger family protein [Campylobacter pinnipediorum subsp. caledonicus]AQW88043.1 Na+/H+ exchanger family protein [Campylobacter pinnipediorum subsp. caledonicus]